MGEPKNILWDFDGTLAHRPGMWSGALASVLAAHGLSHIGSAHLVPYLQTGFPWHSPEVTHQHLSSPEAWWAAMERIFVAAYTAVGVPATAAAELAGAVRHIYLAPDSWVVYDDTCPVLKILQQHGWRHIILSNHVPELPQLVDRLGLASFFDDILTSAALGYEKPHPEAFRIAVERTGKPEHTWVIGDSIITDVLGAEKYGLKAVLVRHTDERARYHCPDLRDVEAILTEAT